MIFEQFRTAVINVIHEGMVLKNPDKGTSTIKSLTGNKISYIRGKSTISISYSDLYNTYLYYRGNRVSSSELKKLAPSIFDSNARRCWAFM